MTDLIPLANFLYCRELLNIFVLGIYTLQEQKKSNLLFIYTTMNGHRQLEIHTGLEQRKRYATHSLSIRMYIFCVIMNE